MTMKARLITFVLCTILCSNLFSQSAAVWNNGLINAVSQVDSTEVFNQEGKPYLQIWSSDRLVYSDYADSLQYFPVGEDVVIPVTSILLSSSELSIQLGHSETLIATVLPDNATDKTVTWTTSDASIASVKDGAVTANNLGTAIITATAGNKSAECQVTVLPIEVTSVTLDITNLELTEGDSKTLTATVTPDNATNKNITWSSSNTAIAKVNESGMVTAVKAGSAIITVTTENGGKTATCSVTVNEKSNVENPEEGENWDW